MENFHVTVLEDMGMLVISGKPRRFMRCLCHCGKSFTARTDHITRSFRPVRSCGCLSGPIQDRLAYNALPKGRAAANQVFTSYRNKCRKRVIPFEIDLDKFIAICSQDCHYCGLPPSSEFKGWFVKGLRSGKPKVNGGFRYNGIDRIVASLGYIEGNMRPACKHCNIAKLDRTDAEFFGWIKRLAEHQGLCK